MQNWHGRIDFCEMFAKKGGGYSADCAIDVKKKWGYSEKNSTVTNKSYGKDRGNDMQYHHVAYEQLKKFCEEVFKGYNFTEEESRQITDVLLAADLSGIESHGIQRLIRYHQEITWGLVKLDAKPEVVFETPLSAVIEGNDCMGQTLGVKAMNALSEAFIK